MVYDRLSVLVIRIAFTERAARSRHPDGDAFGARLPILLEQLALLQQALEVVFDDVQAGRRRFVPYRSLKLYSESSSRRGDSRRD